jgi:hypothetical protein
MNQVYRNVISGKLGCYSEPKCNLAKSHREKILALIGRGQVDDAANYLYDLWDSGFISEDQLSAFVEKNIRPHSESWASLTS